MEIEEIRRIYRPDDIRVLFVGESAPESGKFFYKADSQMYRNMEQILGPKLFGCSEKFLENFKAAGCYVDDLVLRPINKTPDHERKQLCERSVSDLANRISDYNPRIVISLLKKIKVYVKSAVFQSNVDVTFYATYFPGNGQQRNFQRDIEDWLPDLLQNIKKIEPHSN